MLNFKIINRTIQHPLKQRFLATASDLFEHDFVVALLNQELVTHAEVMPFANGGRNYDLAFAA
jgi:hypothetical protein